MFKTDISIGNVLEECAREYNTEFLRAVQDLTDSRYVQRRTKLSHEQFQSLCGGYFLFDHKHSQHQKPILNVYIDEHRKELSHEAVVYLDALLGSNIFDVFQVLRVSVGRGLAIERLKTGTVYNITEHKGTYQIKEGEVIVGRIWQTGDEWQLAPDILMYPAEAAATWKKTLAETKPTEHKMDAKIVYRALSDPDIESVEEAEEAVERFIRDHEAGSELRGSDVLQWFRKSLSIEDTMRRCLVHMRLNEKELDTFTELLSTVWNAMPSKERGGDAKIGHWKPGPVEIRLLEILRKEMMEHIDPDSFESQEDLNRAVEEFQEKWVDTPRTDEGGLTPREAVAQERKQSNHPDKDWTVKISISQWGGVEQERANALLRAGNTAHRRGDLTKAEDYYRQVISEYEDVYPAWGNLGLVLAGQGRKQEAIQALERAIAIKPDYQLARQNLEYVRSLSRAELMKRRQVVSASILRIGLKEKAYQELESQLASKEVGETQAVRDVAATVAFLTSRRGKRVRLTPALRMWPLATVREINKRLTHPNPEFVKMPSVGRKRKSDTWHFRSQLEFHTVDLLYDLLLVIGLARVKNGYYVLTKKGTKFIKLPVIHQFIEILWAYFAELDWSGGVIYKKGSELALTDFRSRVDGIIQQIAPERLEWFLKESKNRKMGWVSMNAIKKAFQKEIKARSLKKYGEDISESGGFGAVVIPMFEDDVLWEKLVWFGLVETNRRGSERKFLKPLLGDVRPTPLGKKVLPALATEYVDSKHRINQMTRKIGRNELCPCGSGKKYKKCCLE